ncbi:hypothetical protein CASFOL_015701 [Castilleja foliolosa]|uniref:H15 domain-containing protein n=1 Tax=Castilleja foliolosa TaxID=1961234 RepID=A0ABD3DET7_9LAMI
MDPASDPPPLPDQPTAEILDATAASTVANNTFAHASSHNDPPYPEMITAAISALNEPNGSSKRAIAKYIEAQYSDLPSTHDELLTHNLKRLKIDGQLVMVKHSYKLPRSVPVPAPVNGAVNAVPSDPASSGLKRRPGRPPKPKPDSVQVAVPVFEPPININAVPVSILVAEPSQPNVDISPANGLAASGGQTVRGRGRPPKNGGLKQVPSHTPESVGFKRGRGRPPGSVGVKRGRGRPPKSGGPSGDGSGGGPVRRGRGRPKAAAVPAPLPAPAAQVRKRPGRPPKAINVVGELVSPGVPAMPAGGGGEVTPVAGKRRGRPPRAGSEAKRPRQLSGKPLGRPKKNASAEPANRSPDSQLLMAYLDLKAKFENLQSRISQTAILIKPSLNNEAAVNALQELELIAMNVTIPPSAAVAQNQQPQPEQDTQQLES